MPYNPSNIPDAPLPISMLPDAEELTIQDLLLITQLGNTNFRSRRLTLDALFGSAIFKNASALAAAPIYSNILDFTGALPQFSTSSTSGMTKVAEIDCDPRYDVEFHVWGESNVAGGSQSQTRYEYGLTGIVRQIYDPDDVDRDLLARFTAGYKASDIVSPGQPVYNGVFHTIPYDYTSDIVSKYPTKKVSLYLSSGTSASPYQDDRPSSFTLKIQAKLTLANYKLNLLATP